MYILHDFPEEEFEEPLHKAEIEYLGRTVREVVSLRPGDSSGKTQEYTPGSKLTMTVERGH